jgi:trigger factor
MKFEVEDLGATKKRLKVEIAADDVEKALNKAYAELNKSVKIEGFRPGHAPRGILEKRYGKGVEADVLEKLIPAHYFQAAHEAGIIPVDNPKFDEGNFDIKKGQPISFVAEVEVRPDIQLSEYKEIEVPEEELAVSEDELSQALEELRDVNSTLETVSEDRAAVDGDYAVIDFEGFVGDAPIQGGKAENYALKLGSGSFIPGFEEQLAGMKKGDDREIKVTFPEDYKNRELAGKETSFKIKLNEIKNKVLPLLDDEFAKDTRIAPTLEEMKAAVREDILAHKRRGLIEKQKDKIMEELGKRHDFELPPSLVDREFKTLQARHRRELLSSGLKPEEAGEEMKRYEEEAKKAAADRVKVSLVLATISDKEGIVVSDTELEAGIRRLAVQTGQSVNDLKDLYLKREGGLEALRGMLGEEKVLEFVLSQTKKVKAA